PRIPRWKDLAGLQNPNFLNVDLFVEHFAGPCSAILGERLGPVLLEFTAFRDEIVTLGPELGHRISQFVKAVNLRFPEIQFAVEFRNRALAVPALFECLEPAVPAMTSWTRMIAIEEQWTRLLKLKRNWPFLMARPVLRPGKLKADADAQYSPFGRLHERITPMRATLIDMWQFARAHNIPSYFMISNTIEGCAHRTIAEIVESS
ncbi:MAG TPA: DUF72 domain-containing protein, partial [Oligoflexia bacterium]|nr:DUF72 domain-containing protein [Oligoflexia bacterium]